MSGFLRIFKAWDWWLVAAVAGLMALGLAALASVAMSIGEPQLFWRQVVWAGVGVGLMVAASFVDYRVFFTTSRVLVAGYAIVLGLLATLLIAGPTIRGATSWFRVGQVISVEPVEVAKLVTILLLAKYLASRHEELGRFRHVLISGGYTVAMALLVLMQPDLGSVLVLVGVWFGMVCIAGLPLRHMITVVLIGAIVAAFGWGFALHDYQKARILSYLNPASDPQGAGYQARQATIAVGAGGVMGQGAGHGIQTGYQFLPEAASDFIFAAFAEEWGLAGVTVLLALFALLFWRVFRMVVAAPNNFARLVATGMLTLLVLQAGINIGMNLGVLPITGLTLPLVSYGGSSLVVLCVSFGLLQGIRARSAFGSGY